MHMWVWPGQGQAMAWPWPGQGYNVVSARRLVIERRTQGPWAHHRGLVFVLSPRTGQWFVSARGRPRDPNRRFAPSDQVGRSDGCGFKRSTGRDSSKSPSDPSRLFPASIGVAFAAARASRARRRRPRTSHSRFIATSRALGAFLGLPRPLDVAGRPRARVPLAVAVAVEYPCAPTRASRVTVSHRAFVVSRHRRLASSPSPSRLASVSSRASRTSGRNARKPSSKSSCPRRHRRTRSITPSGVSLRRRRRRRQSFVARASSRVGRVASRRVARRRDARSSL